MSMNSLLADTLARIKNAQMARKPFTLVKASGFVEGVLSVLKQEGYIGDFLKFEERKGVALIKVDLLYYKGSPVISQIKMHSKPGCRVYKSVKDIPISRNGLGTFVVSTSKGIVAGHTAVKDLGIGGEVLFEIFA